MKRTSLKIFTFNKVIMFWSYLKTFRVLPSYIANLQRKVKIHRMARDISDKDRLMDGHIKLPQNYFEMAIRQNNDIPSMKKALIVRKVHVVSSTTFLPEKKEQLV